MAIFSEALLALVGGHFVFLSFLTAWHIVFCFTLQHVLRGELKNYLSSCRYESTVACTEGSLSIVFTFSNC